MYSSQQQRIQYLVEFTLPGDSADGGGEMEREGEREGGEEGEGESEDETESSGGLSPASESEYSMFSG